MAQIYSLHLKTQYCQPWVSRGNIKSTLQFGSERKGFQAATQVKRSASYCYSQNIGQWVAGTVSSTKYSTYTQWGWGLHELGLAIFLLFLLLSMASQATVELGLQKTTWWVLAFFFKPSCIIYVWGYCDCRQMSVRDYLYFKWTAWGVDICKQEAGSLLSTRYHTINPIPLTPPPATTLLM